MAKEHSETEPRINEAQQSLERAERQSQEEHYWHSGLGSCLCYGNTDRR